MILPDQIDDGVSEDAREQAIEADVVARLADRKEIADMLSDVDLEIEVEITAMIRILERQGEWNNSGWIWDVIRPAERIRLKLRAIATDRAKAAAERVA